MTKKTIDVIVGTIKPYHMEGKIDDAIGLLTRVKENYHNAVLSWGYEDQFSEHECFCVTVSREESDNEYQKRLDAENALNARKINDLQKRAEELGFKLVVDDGNKE